MPDTGGAYHLALQICSVGIVIDALERIASASKYKDAGDFSWVVLRQRLITMPAPVRRLADVIFRGALTMVVVLVVRIGAAGLAAAAPVGTEASFVGLSLIVATHLFVSSRTGALGAMGSDPMTLLICGGTLIATGVGTTPLAAQAGLWFIAAQCCLSYVVAGIAKLKAAGWRSGRAMTVVLSTYSFGNARLHALVSARPRLSWLLSWSVILWETTFPLVLVVPRPAVLPLLALGVAFHASLAALMGLNLFLLTFPAAYVAIWALRT